MKICLALLLFLPLPAFAQATIPDDIGVAVYNEVIEPTAAEFEAAATRLADATEALCAAPDAGALDAARAAYVEVVGAFGRLSTLRFGPVSAANRFERLFFWPDQRGVTLRQVQGLIAEKDESALSAAGLAGKSVALQGLPALDFVLHGDGADDLTGATGAYRCHYGAAIGENIAEIAAEIVTGWATDGPYHRAFTAPGPQADPFRSPEEVASEIVKALATAAQYARDAEIAPALGESFAEARPKRAPLWRSGATFALLEGQIEGMIALVDASGFAEIAGDNASTTADAIAFDLGKALERVAAVTLPSEQAFADEEAWRDLRYVTVALSSVNRILGEGLSTALGLRMGFNALDGD